MLVMYCVSILICVSNDINLRVGYGPKSAGTVTDSIHLLSRL